ncbi:MAG: GNAT family N-acetyltransferase [Bacteriovorax sp.]|nr:GNAT family N-acetyltransferase [Bacteriovorax sp.]
MASLSLKKVKIKNGNEVSIRSANIEDAKATLNIKRSSILEEIHQLVTPSEFKTTLESEAKWIEKHLDNPYYIAIVAILNNEIVGLIDFSNGENERISHTGDFGMSVDTSVRSLGIGTHLLQALIDWAKSTKKIEKINLRVHSDNEIAIGLYKKMGFDIEGVQQKDLKYGPGKYVDTILMGKILATDKDLE